MEKSLDSSINVDHIDLWFGWQRITVNVGETEAAQRPFATSRGQWAQTWTAADW